MKIKQTLVSYTFAGLAGILFVSGLVILTGRG